MNWLTENNKLVKEFSFGNQTELAEFIKVIALYADEIGHHPDFSVFKCSRIRIELSTHDTNSITQKDTDLAAFIDKCYATNE
jgi:4a-hydroxytetrahydrobiopterin dehydratase